MFRVPKRHLLSCEMLMNRSLQ